MKKILLIFLIISCIWASALAETEEEKLAETMTEFDAIMEKIGKLPDMIDEALCSNDMAAYRSHMTELAQNIINANQIIKDVHLYYPIDLWTIYNRISRNPVCGGVSSAADAFYVADVSRISNEEKMGILENDDLCMCWNIATGRDEPNGFMKDGACRCTYGINNYDPNIGRNK